MYQTLIFISHPKLLYKKRRSKQKKNYNDFSKQHVTNLKQLVYVIALIDVWGNLAPKCLFKIKFQY